MSIDIIPKTVAVLVSKKLLKKTPRL